MRALPFFNRLMGRRPSGLGASVANTTVPSNTHGSHAAAVSDHPIERTEDDVLGRTKLAKSFAQQILSLDASRGLVVGVLGPWGAGKTSVINLAERYLESNDVPVLRFNPWMFSGADQLVDSFFIELSSQLRLRSDLADLGARLEEYGEAFSGLGWLPVVGTWIQRGKSAATFFAKMLARRKEGTAGRRRRVEHALAALERPIVVVIDDIDRLTTPEIRDVFKLVRLTASFPKIIYVLAFDRSRVEQALAEQGINGRDYLEKILQIGLDLPAIPGHVLNKQIFNALDAALEKAATKGVLDANTWPDVFMEIVRPLVKNMRDVRRYAMAVQGTVNDLDGQVALVDVLGLEAIRVFLPEVFAELHRSVDGLTAIVGLPYGGAGREPPHLKQQVDRLLSCAGEHTAVVRAVIERLFPAAQRYVGGMQYGGDWISKWLRDRRVANEHVLRRYLERVVGEGLQAFTDAERAWTVMADRQSP